MAGFEDGEVYVERIWEEILVAKATSSWHSVRKWGPKPFNLKKFNSANNQWFGNVDFESQIRP